MNKTGYIPGLEPDEWSNDACRGYVIMAMQDCGFSSKDIQRVLTQLYEVFDFYTLEQAKQVITNLGAEWPEVEKIQRTTLLACRLLTFPHRTKGNELAHNPRFEKEFSYDTGCYLPERNTGCCISGKDHRTGKSYSGTPAERKGTP